MVTDLLLNDKLDALSSALSGGKKSRGDFFVLFLILF
jgi:hypothetical protein